MDEVIVHPRVHERHPEVSVEDVLSAWKHAIRSAPRVDDSRTWVSVGVDVKGRLLEMVAVHNGRGDWLVYHAMTPPSKKLSRNYLSTGGDHEPRSDERRLRGD